MNPEPTVFVVDDDDAMRHALCFLGQALDLKLEAYASAQAFLDNYDPERPGCLVLDLCMPGMSGLELQAQLATRRIRLPIILITGHGDTLEVRRAFEAGAVDVLEKPFRTEILIERIQHVLEGQGRASEIG